VFLYGLHPSRLVFFTEAFPESVLMNTAVLFPCKSEILENRARVASVIYPPCFVLEHGACCVVSAIMF